MVSNDFIIPSHWDCKPLVDCTSNKNISYGIVQPGQHDESGIGIIRVNNFENGELNTSDVLKVTPSIESKFAKTRLSGGEVLLTLVGSTGQSAVVPNELKGWNVARAVAVIKPSGEVTAEWLNICLQSSHTRNFLDARANTTVQKTLNLKDVKDIPIPLPPKDERDELERIAVNLNKKITLNRQINHTLEQMAQSLFKSWFVDFDPVVDNALDAGFFEQDLEFSDELLRRAEARKAVRECSDFKPLSNDIRQLFPAAFVECVEPSVGINGWIPKGWFIAPLDNIANFQNGLALQKFRPDSDEDEYLPVLKIAQLRQGYCDDNERARIDLKESCRVYNGDMIFSWSGTLMTDIWTGGNAALNQHLYKVTSSKYPLSFYFHWTNHHLVRFQHIAAAKAVTMGHIKKGDLSDSFCVVPKNQTLAYFDSIAGAYLEQAKNVRLQCNTLVKLRDCLLPKLISGELCLENIEAKPTSESVV